VGKNHALTALLMNANFLKECLAKSCVQLIQMRKLIGQNEIYGRGSCNWVNPIQWYTCFIFDYDFMTTASMQSDRFLNADYLALQWHMPFSEEENAYDSALFWMVGAVLFDIDLELNQTKKDTVI
jgi:hypothetical protein